MVLMVDQSYPAGRININVWSQACLLQNYKKRIALVDTKVVCENLALIINNISIAQSSCY